MVLGGMMVGKLDIPYLLKPFGSLANFTAASKLLLRHATDRLRFARGTRLVMGNALVGRLFYSLRQRNVPIEYGATLVELVRSNDRVEGAVVDIGDKRQTIHSYGWYLRQDVAEAKAKGATVIVCSPLPRNQWSNGKIKRGFDGYAAWAKEAAQQSGAYFIDLNTISADKYDALGQDATKALFNDNQHSRKAGAHLNAESVVTGVKALNVPLAKDLAPTAK